jgi:hypothetical protein
MIRYRSQKQLSLADFEWPFQVALDTGSVPATGTVYRLGIAQISTSRSELQ